MPNKTRDYGDLRVTMTYEYNWTWDTSATGAKRGLTTGHPIAQDSLRALGSYAEPGSFHSITQKRATLLVGQNPNTQPSKSAVAAPTDYTQIWTTTGSPGTHQGSIWRPVAPAGYVSLGDVIVYKLNKPPLDTIWCVREDLVGAGSFPASSLWDDTGSRANSDCAIWKILPNDISIDGAPNIPVSADTFRAFASYGRPQQDLAGILLLPVGRDFVSLDTSVPKFTKDTIPPRGKQFDYKEQCKVTLPFHCFFPPTDESSLQRISDPFCAISKSIAWFTEGVWVNNAGGAFTRSQRVLCGVSKEKREEMSHSAGVEISATYGVKAFESAVTLNYQFTYSSSSTFTEYSEREVTETFEVPAYSAKVLFTKHVWIKGLRSDGSTVMNQLEFATSDDVYYSGCAL